MSYSTMAHALISYVEGHLGSFDLGDMSESFGFSEIYLRELFLKNTGIPIMQYCRRRMLITSAFELLHTDKKIIDVALASGYSNHESYIRAFQKVFGMSPSQFRLSRPLIGRKQLDTGVFGLEKLARKEKRSDVFLKLDNDNTILYGIRKIEQGAYGSNTMFPICVKAVSEYLGDDVSFAYIMAVTGAAFRLVWNQIEWDLSNIDIYHTLRESNEIYQYGARALEREFSFMGRDADTSKEEFLSYIKSHIAQGYPVIALGIIGPPEPCIVAGYEDAGDLLVGWNFFQNDPEFAAAVSTMDNGYFRCDSWWENTDTQAAMCIGAVTGEPCADKEIIELAAKIMEAREDESYAKGLEGYDAWKSMLLDEKWFEHSAGFDDLFSKLLVQNDAMVCIADGRKWAAGYFEEISEKFGAEEKAICQEAADHFRAVSNIAGEMMALIGDWSDIDTMLKNFGSRSVREEIGRRIDSAKKEDKKAYDQIKLLLENI